MSDSTNNIGDTSKIAANDTHKPSSRSLQNHAGLRRSSEERRGQGGRVARQQGVSLETIAERAQSESPRPRVDRRRKRLSVDDIEIPKRQISMGAMRFAYRSSDVIWVSLIIMFGIWNAYIGINNRTVLAPIAAGALGAIGFIVMLFTMRAHRFAPSERYSDHMKTVLTASAAALGLWLSFALIVRPETFLPDALAKAGLMATAGLALLHSLYYAHANRLHKRGALTPTIVMLGATESARRLIEENAKTRELNILAIFDERISRAPHNIHGVPVVGRIQDLLDWDALPYVNRIVVTLPSVAKARQREFVEHIRLLPNRIAFVVDEFETLDHVQQRLTQIAEIGMREVTGKPKSGRHTAIKRLMDITISGLALTLGAPILLLLAILIKLDSPGPVLFKQKRHGFNNRIFEVFKFRSLKVEHEDKNAAKQVTANDDRITPFGRFIRKTSLDELPQLFNVLRGEMSIVGPRPHAVGMRTGDVESYKLVEEYAHRHRVKPGMTGWAQINGSRGPLHNADDVARRVKLDVEYIERSAFWLDLMIIIKTVPCLLGDSENIR